MASDLPTSFPPTLLSLPFNSSSQSFTTITTNSTSTSSSTLTPPPLRLSAQIGIAILSLAFVLGFPGNLFVVWSVWCRVKKRSVTCLLVLNLALADASVLLSTPFFLRYLAGCCGWEFGSAACKLVHYLSSVNMYVSIYLICLMSMDRWLAVTRPFVSQRMRTKRTLLAILLGVWIMAFLLSLPMPFYRSNLKSPYNSWTYCIQYHWKSVGHQVFQYLFETIMGFLVPFTLITTCYASVFCRLRGAMFQRRGQSSRLILLIVGTFGLFWLPYHIINITEVVGLLHSEAAMLVAKKGRPSVTAFAYFSSAANPILYVFAGSSNIRRAGLSFLGKFFEATNSESRTTSTSRSTRTSRSDSMPGESSALRALSLKLGGGFRKTERGNGEGPAEEGHFQAELKTLATLDE